jgi:uroporphyrinogen decarboxylase
MIFIDACFGKKTPYTPIWMMRQAGRYLSEYMEVRAKAGNFLNLCHNPKMACEVTLQPIDILGVDAAILFSDILVVPNEMGMELQFLKGEGPKFPKPLETDEDLENLDMSASEKLTYVYETIQLVRKDLDPEKALIGFAGSPWTLATYMIEGGGTKTYSKVKKLLYSNPEYMHKLLEKLTKVLIEYLQKQIDSGVNAVQVFDSWAAALEKDSFFKFSWKYMVEIAETLKKNNPEIPVILFPKGVGAYLDGIYGNFDVFGVDWGTPIELAKEKLGDKYVLQGNLEPTRLYSKEAIDEGVEHILDTMQNDRHIFNLGHGMLPDLDRENAKYLVKKVQTESAK